MKDSQVRPSGESQFRVGDKVVIVDAAKSDFYSIANGTIIKVTCFNTFDDVLCLGFLGSKHKNLGPSETYYVRSDCVVSIGVFNSPLYRALL